MHRDPGKQEQQPTSREDRILKPGDFPQGKIGSGYMATIAGQPAIREMATRTGPATEGEEERS